MNKTMKLRFSRWSFVHGARVTFHLDDVKAETLLVLLDDCEASGWQLEKVSWA